MKEVSEKIAFCGVFILLMIRWKDLRVNFLDIFEYTVWNT